MKKKEWAKDSYKNFTAEQQPKYPDDKEYQDILSQLGSLPPLVFSGEIESLKNQIAEAGAGKRFILQGGDCAERFIDCRSDLITSKLKILLQMSVILTYGARKPVVRIGRIAGQYAKPRSNTTETVHGKLIPIYRGDNVNGYEPTLEARTPDPHRLLKSYFLSASTLNFIRAMIDGGFTDLHHPYQWNLYSIEKTPEWPMYQEMVEHILDSIRFMESFGGVNKDSLGRADFYTSHEGLLLGFEEALTRKSPLTGKYYNYGAHMLWIGERTRQLAGAHIEYFRGISNPIGIKIGPSIAPEELTELIRALNPENEPGRITLITRMGMKKAEAALPPIIRSVQSGGWKVTWSCDPMHGNTFSAGDRKTRSFDDILAELEITAKTHRSIGSILSGVHFELTGEEVTECIGGAIDLKHTDLNANYESYCDPRLNYIQGMEMAFLIARLYKETNKSA